MEPAGWSTNVTPDEQLLATTATNSGTNTLTLGAAQSYVGGAATSVITTSGGTAQSAAVNGGTGSANELIVASATDIGTTAAAAEFTGFERGIRWNDPAIGIAWPTAPSVVSARDAAYPLLGA